MLSGRANILHPRIHAGIATAEIGIVAVNLIPLDFSNEKTLNNMDIGGVAMLRAGIKNFEHVAVIVKPARYNEIIEELRNEGETSHACKNNITFLKAENVIEKFISDEYHDKIGMNKY